jgi:hypothetical protein
MKSFFNRKSVVLILGAIFSFSAFAGPKSYTEDQFLTAFSGKSKKVVLERLGAPVKKEQSVKPTNANSMIAGRGKESSKPVNVEMWYYNGLVNYAPNKSYKFTELTFVNDRCSNIAFFNNK